MEKQIKELTLLLLYLTSWKDGNELIDRYIKEMESK